MNINKNDNNGNENTTTNRSRRATAQEREDMYLLWLEFYQEELSPYEIVDALDISETQFRAYLARGIYSGDIQAVAPKYKTCRAREFPQDIQKQLDVEGKDLVKIEVLSDGGVRLSALKPRKEVEAGDIEE